MVYKPINSYGVQITGHLKSCLWQTEAIAFALAAFAMCTQFHVTRKSIPSTAAIAMWAC
jgi:hypothetical protein